MSVLLVNGNALHVPLADKSVQMAITSPPYFNAREEYASWPNYPAYLADMEKVWMECYRVLCDGGRIAVNVPQGYGRPGNGKDGYFPIGHKVTDQLTDVGFKLRGHIVWNKGHYVLGTAWGSYLSAGNPSLRDQHEIVIVAHKGSAGRTGGRSTIDAETFNKATSSVWDVPPAPESWHPAPFPPEIPRRLIELYTFAGDTVLDPFSGSGTTAYVADRLGRCGIGLEMSSEYVRRSAIQSALESGQWDTARALAKRPTRLADLPMFAEGTAE